MRAPSSFFVVLLSLSSVASLSTAKASCLSAYEDKAHKMQIGRLELGSAAVAATAGTIALGSGPLGLIPGLVVFGVYSNTIDRVAYFARLIESVRHAQEMGTETAWTAPDADTFIHTLGLSQDTLLSRIRRSIEQQSGRSISNQELFEAIHRADEKNAFCKESKGRTRIETTVHGFSMAIVQNL